MRSAGKASRDWMLWLVLFCSFPCECPCGFSSLLVLGGPCQPTHAVLSSGVPTIGRELRDTRGSLHFNGAVLIDLMEPWAWREFVVWVFLNVCALRPFCSSALVAIFTLFRNCFAVVSGDEV